MAHKTLQLSCLPSANKIFDWLGMAASILCLAHCLLIPLILSVLALSEFGGFDTLGNLHDSFFHTLIFFLVFPSAILSFFWPHKHCSNPSVLVQVFGGVGLLTLSVALLLPEGFWHTTLTVLGGLLVGVAHFFNFSFSVNTPSSHMIKNKKD